MEIRILKACTLKLPSGAEQTFPVGWQGEVDAAAAGLWIRNGHAEAIRSAGAAAALPQFTPEQAEVLAGAADLMLSQHLESSHGAVPGDEASAASSDLCDVALADSVGAEPAAGRTDEPGTPAPVRRARASR